MPTPKKIDSNVTGLAIAEEESIGVLGGSPVWFTQEPNGYGDFGSETSNVARAPLNASRQRQKGTVVDLNANAAFTMDFTQSNAQRLLQGFFFADAHEKAKSQPFNAAAVALTATTTTAFNAAAGLGAFKANQLVMSSGFSIAGNNGLRLISAASATALTTTGLTVETPSATAKVEAVGFQFPSADVALSVVGGLLRMTSAATNLTTIGLNVGEWVFIGGDGAAFNFGAAATGFGRVKTIAATYVDFDDTTFAPAVVAGTGKTIQLFFGTFLRNEKDPALIKQRYYQQERTLGDDGTGVQAQYLIGNLPNQLTLNIPAQDKLNAELTFVPTDEEFRTGAEGLKAGTRVASLGEEAINTSSDLHRLKISVIDPTSSNPTSLFGYATEGSVVINNGVTPVKALGSIGAIAHNVGDFMVSGSVTALFSTVEAVKAVRNNADVSLNGIFCRENSGFVFDIPLLQLGGGKLSVEKDQSINIPLTQEAAENANGYTASMTFFTYLPEAAM